jgi:hypothetical protein
MRHWDSVIHVCDPDIEDRGRPAFKTPVRPHLAAQLRFNLCAFGTCHCLVTPPRMDYGFVRDCGRQQGCGTEVVPLGLGTGALLLVWLYSH